MAPESNAHTVATVDKDGTTYHHDWHPENPLLKTVWAEDAPKPQAPRRTGLPTLRVGKDYPLPAVDTNSRTPVPFEAIYLAKASDPSITVALTEKTASIRPGKPLAWAEVALLAQVQGESMPRWVSCQPFEVVP